MKPSYYSIPLAAADDHHGGLTKIFVAPREWLAAEITEDFDSGIVLGPVALISGKQFLELQCIPQSHGFETKPKSGKTGNYNEIDIAGILNNNIPNVLQTLQTMRYSELIAVTKDRKGRKRIVGNIDAAMHLSFPEKTNNKSGGEQNVAIELVMETEDTPPFYIDDSSTPADLNAIYSQPTIIGGNDMAPVITIAAGVASWTADVLTIIEKVIFPTVASFVFAAGSTNGGNDIIDSTNISPSNRIIDHDVYMNPGDTIYFGGVPDGQQFFLATRKLG